MWESGDGECIGNPVSLTDIVVPILQKTAVNILINARMDTSGVDYLTVGLGLIPGVPTNFGISASVPEGIREQVAELIYVDGTLSTQVKVFQTNNLGQLLKTTTNATLGAVVNVLSFLNLILV